MSSSDFKPTLAGRGFNYPPPETFKHALADRKGETSTHHTPLQRDKKMPSSGFEPPLADCKD